MYEIEGGINYNKLRAKNININRMKTENTINKMSTDLGKYNQVESVFWPLLFILHIFGTYPILKRTTTNEASTSHTQTHHNNNISLINGFHENSGSSSNSRRRLTAEIYCENKMEHEGTADDSENVFLFAPLHRSPTFESGLKLRKRYLKSFTICFSLIMTVFTLFNWLTVLSNVGFGWKYPIPIFVVNTSKGDSENSIIERQTAMFRTIILTEATCKLVTIFAILMQTKSFVTFLNRWGPLELQFAQTFGVKLKVVKSLTRFRNLSLLIYVLGPSCLWIPVHWFKVFSAYKSSQVFPQICMFWCAILIVVGSVMEDVKLFTMLQAVKLSYEQVKRRILEGVKGQRRPLLPPQEQEELTVSRMMQWQELIHRCRRQAELIGESCSSQELIFIIETIIICSYGFYALFNFIVTYEDVLFTVASVTFCLNYPARLYMKTMLADRIYEQEKAVGRIIIETRLQSPNPQVQKELKFLHQWISQSPVTISYGNYVILNKSLLLTISVQIITYLIVILQFSPKKR